MLHLLRVKAELSQTYPCWYCVVQGVTYLGEGLPLTARRVRVRIGGPLAKVDALLHN